MSRIQHILEKAEREGAAMRTSRVTTAGATTTVTVPIELPEPLAPEAPAVIVPGPAAAPAAVGPLAYPAAAAAASMESSRN